MAPVSKYKKPKILILAIGVILLIGIIAFVLAYGIGQGWDVVAAWFGSKYAVLLYVGLGLYALLVTYIFVMDWYKKL